MRATLGVNAKLQGISAEPFLEWNGRARPAVNVHIDEPKAAAAQMAQGTQVIYRWSGDDHAHERYDAAQDRATAQAAKVETALDRVAAKQESQTDALVQLVKTLPETVAQIVRATESAATRTISEVNANTDRHDAEYRAALQEVKQVIADLRAEIAEGHKSLRGDVLGKLDKVLTLLTPPPSEPKLTLMGNERKDAA